MKRTIQCMLLLFVCVSVIAQRKTMFTIRVVENSEYGQPLFGVTVTSAQYTISSTYLGEGKYQIVAPHGILGQDIKLMLNKAGYVVVNVRDLEAVVPAASINKPFIMCRADDRALYTAQLYGEETTDKRQFSEIKQIILADRIQSSAEHAEAMESQSSIKVMLARQVKAEWEKSVRTADSIYNIALTAAINGDYNMARAILTDANLEEEAAGISAQQLALSNKYRLKGDIELLDMNVQSALDNYQKAYQYDSANFHNIYKLYLLNSGLNYRGNIATKKKWLEAGLKLDPGSDSEHRLYHAVFLYQYNLMMHPENSRENFAALETAAADLKLKTDQLKGLKAQELALGNFNIGEDEKGMLLIEEAFRLDPGIKSEYLYPIIAYWEKKGDCQRAEKYYKDYLKSQDIATKGIEGEQIRRAKYFRVFYNYAVHREKCFGDSTITERYFNIAMDSLIKYSATPYTYNFLIIFAEHLERLEDDSAQLEGFLKRCLHRFPNMPGGRGAEFAEALVNYALASFADGEDEKTTATKHFYRCLSLLERCALDVNLVLLVSLMLAENPAEMNEKDPFTGDVKKMIERIRSDSSYEQKSLALALLYTALEDGDWLSDSAYIAWLSEDLDAVMEAMKHNDITGYYAEELESLTSTLTYYLWKMNNKAAALDIAVSAFKRERQFLLLVPNLDNANGVIKAVNKVAWVFTKFNLRDSARLFVGVALLELRNKAITDTLYNAVCLYIADSVLLRFYERYQETDDDKKYVISLMESLYEYTRMPRVLVEGRYRDMTTFRAAIDRIDDKRRR